MKKMVHRLLAFLTVLLCLTSTCAFAGDLSAEPLDLKVYMQQINEDPNKQVFGMQTGGSYESFEIGESDTVPIDLLIMLPKDLNLHPAGEEDHGLGLKLTYRDDQGRINPIDHLMISPVSWTGENVDTDAWIHFCRDKDGEAWDSVALGSGDVMLSYELYRVTSDGDEIECYASLEKIEIIAEFVAAGDEQTVYQMTMFPVVFERAKRSAEETGEDSEPQNDDDPKSDILSDGELDDALVQPDNEESDGDTLEETETPPPTTSLNASKRRELITYLISLGYLPQEYWKLNEFEEAEYTAVVSEAVKQYQRDIGQTIDGIANDKLLKQIKELKEQQIYNTGYDINDTLKRDLIAIGYLPPSALGDQDTRELDAAILAFREDYNLPSNETRIDIALLLALQSAQPTVSPTPEPTPSPIPLIMDQIDAARITEKKDVPLSGIAPVDSEVIIYSKDESGRQMILAAIRPGEDGYWTYTIPAQDMDRYFEDQGTISISAMLADINEKPAEQTLDYNAEPAAELFDYQFFVHGNTLILTGRTIPNVQIVVDGFSPAKSDKDGYFELTLHPAPKTNAITVYFDSDYDHPQTIEIKNERAKAFFTFLQSVPEVAELVLIIILLIAIFVILFLKVKKSASVGKRMNRGSDKGSGSLKQKGGSTHA